MYYPAGSLPLFEPQPGNISSAPELLHRGRRQDYSDEGGLIFLFPFGRPRLAGGDRQNFYEH